LALEREAVALDPDGPAHSRHRDALAFQHGPLFDVQLQIGDQALAAARRRAHPVEVDAVLGHHLAQRAALGVAQVLDRPRIEGARHGRAPEQAAAEARSLLVGEVHERGAVRRALGRGAAQDLQRRHHAEGPVQPAPAGHGVDVRADRERPGPLSRQHRPQVRRLVELDRHPVDLGQALAQEVAGGLPFRRPAHPARALRAAGAAVELAQVGDDPPRRGLHQPTRSRRSACIRQ
jgi:hypothetical protein